MKEDIDSENETRPTTTRREFLGKFGKSAIAVTAASAIVAFTGKSSEVPAQKGGNPGNSFYQRRAQAGYRCRTVCAKDNFQPIPALFARPNNGDEDSYPNRIGNHSKGLPHQSNGEVVPAACQALLSALNSGDTNAFGQIPLGGDIKFTNPQCGLAFDLEGKDAFGFVQPPPAPLGLTIRGR